jgi:hypothetical protein
MPTWLKQVFMLCALAATLTGCYGIAPDAYSARADYYGAPYYRDYGAYHARPVAVYRGGFGYAPQRAYVHERAYRGGFAHGFSRGFGRGHRRG